jgi:uncharacterized coiled-coil protein SlyX
MPPAPVVPAVDHALTSRVASLEQRLAEQDSPIAALRAEIGRLRAAGIAEQESAVAVVRAEMARLREATIAAARQHVSALESA